MEYLVYFVISLLISVAAYMIMPKPEGPKRSVDDLKAPTADAGRPVPVPFGTVTIKGPNYLWYGDKMIYTRKVDDPPAGLMRSPGGNLIEDPTPGGGGVINLPIIGEVDVGGG